MYMTKKKKYWKFFFFIKLLRLYEWIVLFTWDYWRVGVEVYILDQMFIQVTSPWLRASGHTRFMRRDVCLDLI